MNGFATALMCLAASLPLAAAADAPAVAAPAARTLAATLQNIPASILAVPEPSTAWLFGLGFLGLVVLRRTRSGPLD